MYEAKTTDLRSNSPIPSGTYDVTFTRSGGPETTMTVYVPIFTERAQLERVLGVNLNESDISIVAVQVCPPVQDEKVSVSREDLSTLFQLARRNDPGQLRNQIIDEIARKYSV